MGYLNYNLEKVASVIEGEMEKQALSLSRLVGMGINAAKRGKLSHFAKRLEQRNQAMRNSLVPSDTGRPSRRGVFNNAIPESELERSFLGVKNGPASLEARRLGHRVPDMTDGAATISSNMHNSLLSGENGYVARMLTRRQPMPMDAQNLASITKDIRTYRPQLFNDLAAGKNMTATAQSPVPLHGIGGMKNLTDDIIRSGNWRY